MLQLNLDHKTPNRYTENGLRGYQSPYGKLPGVTTVLSATKSAASKQSLKAWRAKIGEAAANDVLAAASNRGTSMHESIESYFKGVTCENNAYYQSLSPVLPRFSTPHLQESAVWHGDKGYAGTVDYFGEFDGRLVVADWKSANKPKNKFWIQDYFIQVAVYAQAINWMYGLNCRDAVVLIGVKDQPYQLFELDSDAITDYCWIFDLRLAKFRKQFARNPQATPLAAPAG